MYIDHLKSFEADLDDTLYHSKTGIAEACKRNIEGKVDFLRKLCTEATSVARHVSIIDVLILFFFLQNF